jgi:hypothetical protein
MTTQATIANRALTKLGAKRIVALSDNTVEARTLASMWDAVRDSELRIRLWSFSIARAQLAADPTPPTFGYSQRFLLPTGWLRLLMVNSMQPTADISDYRGDADNAPWAIEGGYLMLDQDGPANIRYIRSVTDTSLWDASFVEAFACKLAVECCEQITQSSEKRRMAEDAYAVAVREAIRANAIELPTEQFADDTWIMARLRT